MIRPDVTQVLAHLAADLATRIVPEVEPAYHRGTLGALAGMLSILAEEWDRGANRLVEENAAIRDLFRQALPAVDDAPLAACLAALVETREVDVRISTLSAGNDALRAALIDLHAWSERSAKPEARPIEAAIWRELAASVARRRQASANF